MEIEVHQLGGVLGMDRRYLVKDGAIQVIDRGAHRGSFDLAPEQIARIGRLAETVAGAKVEGSEGLASDSMQTTVDIRQGGGSHSLEVHSGDKAPAELWDLIGEVSRGASRD